MRIRAHSVWFPLLVAVFARSVPALGQPPSVVVHESQIRAALDAGRLSVTIPVSAAARSGFTARLHADVLAPDDRVVSSGERDVSIAPGRRVVVLSVAAPESAGSLEDDRLLWHRLAYRLSAGSADEPIAKGTIALGGALGLFSLSAAYRGEVIPGQRYEVRVRAVNPIT